ncbi:hypothetical protein ACJX0J_040360, partial [Zea mays]
MKHESIIQSDGLLLNFCIHFFLVNPIGKHGLISNKITQLNDDRGEAVFDTSLHAPAAKYLDDKKLGNALLRVIQHMDRSPSLLLFGKLKVEEEYSTMNYLDYSKKHLFFLEQILFIIIYIFSSPFFMHL